MRPTRMSVSAILAIGLLAGSAIGVAAQDEEDPVGPPGSQHVGAALFIEKPQEDDPESTATGPLFAYETDNLWADPDGNIHPMAAFVFASDEDWCRHTLSIPLADGDVEDRLDACLEWVETSAFGGSGTGIGRVLLPETWAVRIAKRAGWYPDEVE